MTTLELTKKSKLVSQYTDKLEVMQNILDAIRSFEQSKAIYEENLTNWIYRSFQSLIIQSEHKVKIYDMCIERMKQRFNKQLETLKPL